jgi:hypothetical protein
MIVKHEQLSIHLVLFLYIVVKYLSLSFFSLSNMKIHASS